MDTHQIEPDDTSTFPQPGVDTEAEHADEPHEDLRPWVKVVDLDDEFCSQA